MLCSMNTSLEPHSAYRSTESQGSVAFDALHLMLLFCRPRAEQGVAKTLLEGQDTIQSERLD